MAKRSVPVVGGMEAQSAPRRIALGEIAIGDKIGEGGFGQVFKARLHPLEQTFAVKLLDPHPFNSQNSEALRRFIKEANFLLALRHQNITPIYGMGLSGTQPFILMEYFEGVDLQRNAERNGLPKPDKVLPFMERVSSALHYAHGKGVLHRDIKPSNLLARKDDARVVDFGIAHAIDIDGERLTRSGGTPVGGSFSAPELISDPRKLDARCDVFSLGACWFWLLTGTSPKGLNFEHALRKIDGMTPRYESVILKSLSQPEARYQSMGDMLDDIRRLGAGDDPQTIDSELDDDAITVLAAVFEQHVPHADGFSTFQLEQRVAKVMNKFNFSMAIRTLQKWKFVRIVDVADSDSGFNSYTYKAAVMTDEGQTWVARNRRRVERLLPEARTSAPPGDLDDDIPF